MIVLKMKDVTEAKPDIKLSPLKVIAGAPDKPMIHVNASAEEKKFHPEEMSSRIGLKMKDVTEAYPVKLWPLKVIAAPEDKPMIQLNASGKRRSYHPEEISSTTPSKMKEVTVAYP